MGDLSMMNTNIQDNLIIDQTYDNLLNLKSGKDLINIK